MPVPIIPLVAATLVRKALTKVGTHAAKKAAKKAVTKTKPKAFRPVNARSAEEQSAYLKSIQAVKQTRMMKADARSMKKKIAESKEIINAAKKNAAKQKQSELDDFLKAPARAKENIKTGAAAAGLVATGAKVVSDSKKRKKK